METQCIWRPYLLVKGQGCIVLLLGLLCTLGSCQGSTLTPVIISSSEDLVTLPLQTSFTVDETATTGSLVTSSAFTLTVLEEVVRPSTEGVSHNADPSVESLSSSLPSVTISATPWQDLHHTNSVQSRVEITSRSLEDFSTVELFHGGEATSKIRTTAGIAVLDSVTASLLWESGEGLGTEDHSNLQSLTTTHLDTASSSLNLEEPVGSRSVIVGSTSTRSIDLTLTGTSSMVSEISSKELLDNAPTSLVTSSFSTATDTDMLDMNVTQASTFYPSSTDLLVTSSSVVSSPGSEVSNSSCADNDSDCVEYQGGEEEEEEEVRLRVIVGVACSAVLLVVILGVFIGCVLRRRGKMASGSKIDLSSYWDDSVTLSYINGHVDIPKDSADEMISLDNDSFLNSLDSMSFTNTWTSDTSRHTNF